MNLYVVHTPFHPNITKSIFEIMLLSEIAHHTETATKLYWAK